MACFVIVMITIFNSTMKLRHQHGCAQFSLASMYCPSSLNTDLLSIHHLPGIVLTARDIMVTNISPCLQETPNFKGNLGKKTSKEAIIVIAICSKKIIGKTF